MSYQPAQPPRPAHAAIRAADGTVLFHRDWGGGRPVVFLAGWALCSRMWSRVMLRLAEKGMRCVAYDRRGHGRSGDPGRGYDYDTLADDLAALLDALDLHDAVLVGHSMAGGEIVRCLSRHGIERVRGIVLLAPTLPFPLLTADNPLGYEQAMFDRLRDAVVDDFPGWLDANAGPFFTPETGPGIVAWVKAMMAESALLALAGCFDAMVATDFRAELAALDVPTLIIQGDTDASAPLERTGQPAAALLPRSRLVVYQGAPHGLFVTHADRLQRDLEAFALA